jgi:hypothetical protein
MQKIIQSLTLVGLLTAASSVYAQAPDKPAAKPTMPMNKGKSQDMDENTMLEHLKMRQEHMLMMHDLSNKILAEKDPKKQQELKDQQLELMKSHFMKMRQAHPKRKMLDMPMDH